MSLLRRQGDVLTAHPVILVWLRPLTCWSPPSGLCILWHSSECLLYI